MIVGIDASRNRSGGALAYLIGILSECKPIKYGISSIHIWSHKSLLDVLPNRSWLIKHNPPSLEKSLPKQLWWQFYELPKLLRRFKCDVLFSPDAGTISNFKPMVVMSQDLLSFEPGQMKQFGFSIARLRLLCLKYVQKASLKKAIGAIFLTNYTSKLIQEKIGKLNNISIINHGVDDKFKTNKVLLSEIINPGDRLECIYVSNFSMYKHQWVVVRAIKILRDRGYNITLTLIGGGGGVSRKLTDIEKLKIDPDGSFINIVGFLPHDELPEALSKANIFLFASSCENQPITLLEAMAVGLPIACSNRGPMPETLQDGGVYFDPEDADSIADAVESIVNNNELRLKIAGRARDISLKYSWSLCSSKTWEFIRAAYSRNYGILNKE